MGAYTCLPTTANAQSTCDLRLMGGTDAPILATNGMCSISYNSYNSDWEVDTYERDF